MFDDRFNPLDSNEYDEEDYRRFDKVDVGLGFIKQKKIIYNNDEFNSYHIKTTKLPIYTTGGTGSIIRNALTGAKMPGIVGNTLDEKQYYKMKYLVKSLNTLNGSQTLFFETEKDCLNTFPFMQIS